MLEIVVLLPCKHFDDLYCWGLVMVGQVADLVFVEMEVRVEDFDLVLEVVEEMEMKVEGFDLEVAADFDKMEDIGNIGQISHKDFVSLVPMVEIDTKIEVKAKVATKNSSLVGVEDTLDC